MKSAKNNGSNLAKSRSETDKTTHEYTASQVIMRVSKSLQRNLQVVRTKHHFGALFNDDSDSHSSRRAWMCYHKVYAVKMPKGGWLFAFGKPAGNAYLSENVGADLVLIRFNQWPIDDRLMWKVVRYNVFNKSGNFNFFRATLLVSQNGELLQQKNGDFNLRPLAEAKYPDKKASPKVLPPFREFRNPFSTFLPEGVALDSQLVRSLGAEIKSYMLAH